MLSDIFLFYGFIFFQPRYLERGLIVQDMATTATTLQELEAYFTV